MIVLLLCLVVSLAVNVTLVAVAVSLCLDVRRLQSRAQGRPVLPLFTVVVQPGEVALASSAQVA